MQENGSQTQSSCLQECVIVASSSTGAIKKHGQNFWNSETGGEQGAMKYRSENCRIISFA
jgi:hypothetical protein